jgi:beta-lactamase regulating signal transducer with metallopeptidase domain
MNEIIDWLQAATFAGGAAIILTLVLSPLIRRFLGAQASFVLWILPLSMLVWPWIVPSKISIIPARPELPPVLVTAVLHHAPVVSSGSSELQSRTKFPITSLMVLVWAVGSTIFVGRSVLRAIQTHRLVRTSSVIHRRPPDLTNSQGLRLVESPLASGPAMCGFFNPVIILPKGFAERIDDDYLYWIILHETGHIRRGDMFWCWAFEMARAIHWFNPLVWVAAHAARVDMEMACDEWVLSRSRTDKEKYGEAILRAASFSTPSPSMSASMAETRYGLSRRIRHLVRTHPRGIWTIFIVLIFGVAGAFLLTPFRKASPSATLPPSTPSSPQMVNIKAIFLEVTPKVGENFFGSSSENSQSILNPEELKTLLNELNTQQGIELVSSPMVTTKVDQRATIQIVREFRYPSEFDFQSNDSKVQNPTPTAFATEPVGITLEAVVTAADGRRLVLEATPRVVEFLGFVNYAGERPSPKDGSEDTVEAALRPTANRTAALNQPIFRRRGISTSVILGSGDTVLIGGLSRKGKDGMLESIQAKPSEQNQPESDRVLYILITASLAATDQKIPEAPETSSPTSQSANPTSSNIPSGVPVPDKQGFVTSPHAPDMGYVDVRGLPSGSEVRCPYTGKLFLVP